MNCRRIQRSLSAYCDDRLSGQQRQEVGTHLEGCRECSSRFKRLQGTRISVRSLRPLGPPGYLTTSLRVLASRERARRPSRTGLGELLALWYRNAKLRAEEIMRPVAVPLAGGLLPALVLFGALAPALVPPGKDIVNDVPIRLSTEATFVSMGPYSMGDGEMIVVDLMVDRQGRMVGYSIPGWQGWTQDPEVRRSVENALLFTVFSPGTTFGRPAPGTVRVTFRRSQIDVRG